MTTMELSMTPTGVAARYNYHLFTAQKPQAFHRRQHSESQTTSDQPNPSFLLSRHLTLFTIILSPNLRLPVCRSVPYHHSTLW